MPLLDPGAQAGELTAQVADPVCLLVADVGDVADRRRPVGEQGHDAERRHGVADRVHVDVDAVGGPARDRHGIVGGIVPRLVPLQCAAHFVKRLREGDIPLHAPPRQPLDGDAPAGDCRGGEEVARGRRIGLDGVGLSAIPAGRDRPPCGACHMAGGAEISHHTPGHFQVGERDEAPLEVDRHPRRGAGGDHRQGTGELTRGATADGRCPARHSGGVDRHRWAAAGALGAGLHPEALERVEEIADGALPHPGCAIEPVGAVPQATDRGEEADRRAAGGAVERRGGGRDLAARAVDNDPAGRPIGVEADAEGPQPVDHHPGILTVEGA